MVGKGFLDIDCAHHGRERQGPALDGRLVPSAKGYERVQLCRGCAARRFAVSTHLARVATSDLLRALCDLRGDD
jgi:hypothetical protein